MYDNNLEIGNAMDSRNDYKTLFSIYLPHSCDKWVIGGIEEAKSLIEDLTEAINIFETKRRESINPQGETHGTQRQET
jgi:hypothetical protein